MNQSKRKKSINYLMKVTLLGVISYLLMFVAIPMPPPITFVELDFCNAITIIGGFTFGPIAAILIEGIRLGLHIATTGIPDLAIGELSAFLVSISFAVPASVFYKYVMHNKKGAIISLIIGLFFAVGVSTLTNYYMIFPLYNQVMANGTWTQAFIQNMVFKMLLPYNLGKFALNSIITLLLYKRLSPMLKKYEYEKVDIKSKFKKSNVVADKKEQKYNSENTENNKTTVEIEK